MRCIEKWATVPRGMRSQAGLWLVFWLMVSLPLTTSVFTSEVRWVELEQEERKARIARVVMNSAVFIEKAGGFGW